MYGNNWYADVPNRIASREYIPDDGDYSLQKHKPTGIILHSGDRFEGVAEYAEKEPDGRKISYHFAWSEKHQCFVQMVGLHNRAWHAGPQWNHAIGIALSGPWSQNPRRDLEMCDLIALLQEVRRAIGYGIKFLTRHSSVCKSKKDPGPGIDEWMWRLLEACGLRSPS